MNIPFPEADSPPFRIRERGVPSPGAPGWERGVRRGGDEDALAFLAEVAGSALDVEAAERVGEAAPPMKPPELPKTALAESLAVMA
jgi:hypothetical protein